MCIAIPGRVISIEGCQAEVDVLGAPRKASTLLKPEVQVGDYVLISVGAIVEILPEEDALITLTLFQELMALETADGDSL
jgi:hydrogenase expression/formation protein HypC